MNKRNMVQRITKNLENINNIDTLMEINEFIIDKKPKTLREYIDLNFIEYDNHVRDALEHEVRGKYLNMSHEKVEPENEHISHWCELYVNGQNLDIWISEGAGIFHPYEIANMIFKLWSKEITPR